MAVLHSRHKTATFTNERKEPQTVTFPVPIGAGRDGSVSWETAERLVEIGNGVDYWVEDEPEDDESTGKPSDTVNEGDEGDDDNESEGQGDGTGLDGQGDEGHEPDGGEAPEGGKPNRGRERQRSSRQRAKR